MDSLVTPRLRAYDYAKQRSHGILRRMASGYSTCSALDVPWSRVGSVGRRDIRDARLGTLYGLISVWVLSAL